MVLPRVYAMVPGMGRRVWAIVLLGCAACDGGHADARTERPVREFRAHCEYAIRPNFEIPMKKAGQKSGLTYGEAEPDASGENTAITLTGGATRIVTRFGTPNANDVWVSEYAEGGRANPQAFGRVVKLFRFCH